MRGAARYTAFALGLLVVLARNASAVCLDTPTSHCLQGERFRVQISWLDYVGNGGFAGAVPGGTTDSGLFYFYGAPNWEVLVKVLNGCHQNNRYWVFAAAATTLQYTITVTDTLTGAVRTYFNPLNTSSPAVTDTDAFGCQSVLPTPAPTATPTPQPELARVRYLNNFFCLFPVHHTSTLFTNGYVWQSSTSVPSAYQDFPLSLIGPFTEANDTSCLGAYYPYTFPIEPGRRYTVVIRNFDRAIDVVDEGVVFESSSAEQ